MDKRQNRSQKYQWILVETAFSNDMMEAFCNDDSIYNRLNPFEYNERLLELEDLLKVEFWRIVEESLTEKQRDVIKLCAEGKTQMEIAKALGVNQSSIVKNLRGNTNYTNNNKDGVKLKGKSSKKTYGGTIKKMKKIIEDDVRVKEILEQMRECRNEKW